MNVIADFISAPIKIGDYIGDYQDTKEADSVSSVGQGDRKMVNKIDIYLKPTYTIDSDSDFVKTKASSLTKESDTSKEKAKKLFYFVRDKIKYNPYSPLYELEHYIASTVIKNEEGFCIQKAVVLTALSRAVDIPARLVFADIKNYLVSQKIREFMGTNLFTYHGYCELLIENKWVKATPAFDKKMCEKNDIIPVEFNGIDDAVFPKKNKKGQLHIEYVKHHGAFADLPFDQIIETFKKVYGEHKPEMLE